MKYGKRDAERAEAARKFEEDKERPRSGSAGRRSGAAPAREFRKPIYIEMGGFVFCGDCIEAAAARASFAQRAARAGCSLKFCDGRGGESSR